MFYFCTQNKIEKIKLNKNKMKKLDARARITEVDDTSDRILLLFKNESNLQSDKFLKSTFKELEKVSSQITESIKRETSISKLEKKDKLRDDALRLLHNVLLGYSSIPIAEVKEKGGKLFAVFSKYGLKVIKENYASKSSLIESLLQDLSNTEMQAISTELLGVPESIEKLREEQTAFTNVRMEYEKAMVIRENTVSASSLKKLLLELINTKLITYLTTMKMVDSGQYEHFYGLVSQVIDSTNLTIQRRNKGKIEKKEINKPMET